MPETQTQHIDEPQPTKGFTEPGEKRWDTFPPREVTRFTHLYLFFTWSSRGEEKGLREKGKNHFTSSLMELRRLPGSKSLF